MNYRRPSSKRRVAKWVGLGLCVLLLTAWAASTVWWFGYTKPNYSIACSYGHVVVLSGGNWSGLVGWGAVRVTGGLPRVPWSSLIGLQAPYWGPIDVSNCTFVTCPLWIPFLLLAVFTGILWYRDRRSAPADHCRRCGYNLTGNESGVCPESATPVPARRATT